MRLKNIIKNLFFLQNSNKKRLEELEQGINDLQTESLSLEEKIHSIKKEITK